MTLYTLRELGDIIGRAKRVRVLLQPLVSAGIAFELPQDRDGEVLKVWRLKNFDGTAESFWQLCQAAKTVITLRGPRPPSRGWVQQDGKKVATHLMGNTHLVNAIRFARRYSTANWRAPMIDCLVAEANWRGLKIDEDK